MNLIPPLSFNPYQSRSPNTDTPLLHCRLWTTAHKQPGKGEKRRLIKLIIFNIKIKLLYLVAILGRGKNADKKTSVMLLPHKAETISRPRQFSPSKASKVYS